MLNHRLAAARREVVFCGTMSIGTGDSVGEPPVPVSLFLIGGDPNAGNEVVEPRVAFLAG
jgi:hypothetical protein